MCDGDRKIYASILGFVINVMHLFVFHYLVSGNKNDILERES